jgi:exosome complex component RRP40
MIDAESRLGKVGALKQGIKYTRSGCDEINPSQKKKKKQTPTTKLTLTPSLLQFVCPGDITLQLPETGMVRIGTGLRQEGTALVATKPGIFQQTGSSNKYWIKGRQKRYIPTVNDNIVGTIIERHAESFDVDINAPTKATLPALAFEGATRRNRPNLKPGDAVYARVEHASRDMEPELTCIEQHSGGGGGGQSHGYGQLKEGLLTECSTAQCRAVQDGSNKSLSRIGSSMSFEVAVGNNGKIWVNSSSAGGGGEGGDGMAVILVSMALKATDGKSASEADVIVDTLLQQSDKMVRHL